MPKSILLLTGNIQTGKSAFLMNWVQHKPVAGFITPTLDGRKTFYTIETGTHTPYALQEKGEQAIQVGRFFLSKAAFETAFHLAQKAVADQPEYFILDELGKLELAGEGHYPTFLLLVNEFKNILIIVVREELVASFQKTYQHLRADVVTVATFSNSLKVKNEYPST